MGEQDRGVRAERKDDAAGQAVKERRSKRVAVGGRTGNLAADDLGSHVCHRPEHRARARVLIAAGTAQAEVGQERVVAFTHQHVLRLDVAVQEPRLMGGIERARDLTEQQQGPFAAEFPGANQLISVGPSTSRIARNSPSSRPVPTS